MIEDLVMKQLAATRASAEALIQSIDMIQAIVARSTPPPPPPAPSSGGAEECDHPQDHRIPTPTMGNMSRQLCGVCGKEVTE